MGTSRFRFEINQSMRYYDCDYEGTTTAKERRYERSFPVRVATRVPPPASTRQRKAWRWRGKFRAPTPHFQSRLTRAMLWRPPAVAASLACLTFLALAPLGRSWVAGQAYCFGCVPGCDALRACRSSRFGKELTREKI